MKEKHTYKDIILGIGIGLTAVTVFGATLAGIHYKNFNNIKMRNSDSTSIYKADYPFGCTRLTIRDEEGDILVEKFRFNQHTKTWWDLPETDYLDAYWDGRWYDPGRDDEVLAIEKKNLEKELERFNIDKVKTK